MPQGSVIGRSALGGVVAAVALVIVASATAGGLRYVVTTPGGPAEYTLWTSYTASVNCARALLHGADARPWCEEGIAGIKPRVGVLTHGTEVEVLDTDECRDMVHARVLTGPLKGEIGCIVARGLSSMRPESPSAP